MFCIGSGGTAQVYKTLDRRRLQTVLPAKALGSFMLSVSSIVTAAAAYEHCATRSNATKPHCMCGLDQFGENQRIRCQRPQSPQSRHHQRVGPIYVSSPRSSLQLCLCFFTRVCPNVGQKKVCTRLSTPVQLEGVLHRR